MKHARKDVHVDVRDARVYLAIRLLHCGRRGVVLVTSPYCGRCGSLCGGDRLCVSTSVAGLSATTAALFGSYSPDNLKAQNLNVFCQIAEGNGEETWMFHLRRNDYSRWMRDVIKNEDLAAAVEDIERRGDLSPAQTRALVRAAVEARYTVPE